MKAAAHSSLSLADLQAARRRLTHGLRVTPCLESAAISNFAGASIWLKRDDLQHTGSFKERGARNALLSLSPAEQQRGVIAASAGNHALGLAFHGGQLGVPVTVVVPMSAPEVKIRRCRALGANVVVQGRNFEEAQTHAALLAATTGATVVHPFDDPRVIAGQATMALEFLEQCPSADTFVLPVGGGGLLAGAAAAIRALRPGARVIAVEPENAAGFLAAGLCGRPTNAALAPTLADGLAVSRVGELTFQVAASRVDDVVTVSEEEIATGIAALARHAGTVAEGAGAAALAAVVAGKVRGRTVLVPITGRNIDPALHRDLVAQSPDPRPRAPFAAAA